MTDIKSKYNLSPPEQGNSGIVLVIIFTLFIIACFIAPQHIWFFFAAFIIAIGSMYYFNSAKSGNKANFANPRGNETIVSKEALSQQRLVEALQFPAYILDSAGGVVFANKPSIAAFGKFTNGDKVFIRFRQPELRKLIEKALSSKSSLTGEYNEARPADRWFAVEIAPIFNKKGTKRNLFFLLGFHDLTEAKRTDQMRSDFIANASHELRTPLASLKGYLETIKGPARKDEKAIQKFTDVMLDQAKRMTRLVNDLLSLSRIEMQSHVRPSEIINLNEVIINVIDSVEGLAKHLDVRIVFEASKAVNIIGDRDELLQVFENLIENACKYGEEGKEIIVALERDDTTKSVIASVKDFGPGIALEHQHRITERFYRVDIARSREKQGTGLGLAIVKHILNRHTTRLEIQSAPDEGAKFLIRFPLADK